MHDIDRTQIGSGYEMENNPYFAGEAPYAEEESAYGEGGEMESDETQLAAQLMEVDTEEEFEQFLGDLISKAAKAVGGYINKQTGQSLGGLLKGAARQILPVIDQSLGETGDEYEGGDPNEYEAELEEQEWEAANTFVALAHEAAKNAALAPPNEEPANTANNAVVDAAKVHAPALVAPQGVPQGAPQGAPMRPGFRAPQLAGLRGRTGRWVRRGNQIILYGV